MSTEQSTEPVQCWKHSGFTTIRVGHVSCTVLGTSKEDLTAMAQEAERRAERMLRNAHWIRQVAEGNAVSTPEALR